MLQNTLASSLCKRVLAIGSLFLAAGCLPSSDADSADNSMSVSGGSGSGGSGQNTPPTIDGNPKSRALIDRTYLFQPTAYDADGDEMTFSVQGLPGWASFNKSNGRIFGTPDGGDIATFGGVSITVSDGDASSTLGPFSITVDAFAMGTATLSWVPPTQNTDGTPLTDLAGYRIYWGETPGNYSESVTIENPGLTAYVVDNLIAGNYFFVSTALNSAGVESNFSNEALKSVQ